MRSLLLSAAFAVSLAGSVAAQPYLDASGAAVACGNPAFVNSADAKNCHMAVENLMHNWYIAKNFGPFAPHVSVTIYISDRDGQRVRELITNYPSLKNFCKDSAGEGANTEFEGSSC
jgi:hypothetical protein